MRFRNPSNLLNCRSGGRLFLTVSFLFSAALSVAPGLSAEDVQAVRERNLQDRIRPLIVRYCSDCHGAETAEADVRLVPIRNAKQVLEGRSKWLRAADKLRNKEMPPVDAEQPSETERSSLATAIDDLLHTIDCVQEARPGRVTIRRLNRVEYRNTIRDLLGVDVPSAAGFPGDDVGYGFDNIADVLTLPTILMERYVDAAEEITRQIVGQVESRRRILVDEPGAGVSVEDAARKILQPLAKRAFRRPIAPPELQRLVQLVQRTCAEGERFETAIQLAIQAVLVSPHFLFRIERDPLPNARERQLDDYELATRLSYFLWSSMPNDRLFELADQGLLRRDGNLRREVQRMLESPKSQALVDGFAAQWLELRKFDEVQISTRQFPAFGEGLRSDMRRETTLFFEYLVRQDRSVVELLSADYTFLNERLAKHYGIPDVHGEQFRRVVVTGSPRGGILTQGSFLTVTSNPTRTSPVKRGKWILENLLNDPPPPPPPNVPKLEEGGNAKLTGTLRQQFEQHRQDPSCASCHERMDGLGFALENFDAVGAWRTLDGGLPIDSSGQLPDGATFNGPSQLAELLVRKKKDQFVRCLSEKLLTYALGRGLEYFDVCAVQRIVEGAAKEDFRFGALIWAVVQSDPFQKRGAKPAEDP